MSQRAATIMKGAGYITQINLMRVGTTQQQHDLAGLLQEGAERSLVGRPGFVSAAIHLSSDGSRVVTYVQWADEPTLAAALRAPEFRSAAERVQAMATNDSPRLYDVVYANDRAAGVTPIRAGADVATFINVISTAPEHQDRLCRFVIGNDEKAFSTQPGFRSANFHKSRDGQRVVNYSHWDSEATFLAAISKLLGMPDMDMETANRIATKGAGGLGSTDFRFYEVVFAVARDAEPGAAADPAS